MNPVGAPTFSARLLLGGQPAARLGDFATCAGPIDAIATGCPTGIDRWPHGGTPGRSVRAWRYGNDGVSHGADGRDEHWTRWTAGRALVQRRTQIGNAIFVEDNPQFQAMVINRLALVASTVAGMRVLLSIEASGETLEIEEFSPKTRRCGRGNGEDATARGLPVYNGRGKPIWPWFPWGDRIHRDR